jgi:catechol 2,3-dioxygenase-like lactoylglutathione lyase family enzyme
MEERKRPSVSLGHVVLHTADMKASIQFYETLGLVPTPSPTVSQDDLMLMELRGGTDLLIMRKGSELTPKFPVSRVGYGGHAGPIDIMIPEHDRDDLERYRLGLKASGLEPGEIYDEPQYGHWFFRIVDPNRQTVTVLTSHSSFDP